VARLPEDTVHSLLWRGDRLWIGTGEEGKLYTFARGELVLANDVEERQIMALLPGAADGSPAFATTNAAAFYRLGEDDQRQGTYTSAVLDARQIARFGSFRWLGSEPAGARLSFAFRSGISAAPDSTWTTWTEPREGREIALGDVPPGRYFQWRVTARAAAGESPALAGVEVSYVQENLAPRIAEITALEPGQILVTFNFNPAQQAYEPVHPNRDGIFTTLAPAAEGTDDQRLKPLWKLGYRTLRWKAEDPNEDSLTYRLTFRHEDGEAWLPMAEELTESWYSFDETALPDGVYRFRVEASDGKADEPHRGLSDDRISEPVVVDHTAPRLVRVRREGDKLLVEVADGGNPLREAKYSVGAGPWKQAVAVDGLLDGRAETLEVPAPALASLVILRVVDAAHNTATFDLVQETR
jgi:hypothetical protein